MTSSHEVCRVVFKVRMRLHLLLLFFMFLCKDDIGVHQAPSNADVQTYEVRPSEYVVSTKHHPDVSDEDILNTTYDGGSERRVAQCAQHDGVH